MILLVIGILLAILLATIATILVSAATPSKPALVLVWVTVAIGVAFLPLAVTVSVPSRTAQGGFSHDQLEADRVMTQRMSVAVDPGMASLMASDGMLQRSADPAYVRALEVHIAQFDRVLGIAP